MSLGGKQTTETKIPEWLREPAIRAIERGERIANVGYTPYYGPEVAAMTADQTSANQNNRAAADAFGLSSGGINYMQPTDYGNGAWGFSSQPMFQSAMNQFQQQRPGQYDYINSFFIDPQTSNLGFNGAGAPPPAPMQQMQQPQFEWVDDGGNFNEGSASQGWKDQYGGQGIGGYSGFGDMFDGGGPGASGDTFMGGGLLSNVANTFTSPRGSRR